MNFGRMIKTVVKSLLVFAVVILMIYNGYVLFCKYVLHDGMPSVFGYSFATVSSGSMEPTLKTGDFIVVKSQSDYSVGDIITFYDAEKNAFVTHRIILEGENSFATKGDANSSADNFSVPIEAVKGKVVAVNGFVGDTVRFVQSPFGMFSVVAVAILLWLATDIVSSLTVKKDEKQQL